MGIKNKNSRQKGAVLLTTSLMVMFALCFLGAANLDKLAVSNRSVDTEIWAKKAFYLAEAGIESAMWRADNDTDWSDGSPADFVGSLGDGAFEIVFSSRTQNSLQIESRATVQTDNGEVDRKLKVKVAR